MDQPIDLSGQWWLYWQEAGGPLPTSFLVEFANERIYCRGKEVGCYRFTDTAFRITVPSWHALGSSGFADDVGFPLERARAGHFWTIFSDEALALDRVEPDELAEYPWLQNETDPMTH